MNSETFLELIRLRREQAIDRERIEALEEALAELRAVASVCLSQFVPELGNMPRKIGSRE